MSAAANTLPLSTPGLCSNRSAAALPAPWPSFTTADGRTFQVSCDSQTLIPLRAGAGAGVRLKRRVTQLGGEGPLSPGQIGRLSREDVTHIDFLVVAHGLSHIAALTTEAPALLIVPISYLSLTSRQGRDEVVSAYQELAEASGYGVIAEIREIDGVPAQVVAAAAALVEPASSAVLGHLEAGSDAGLDLSAAGLDGFTFECHPVGPTKGEGQPASLLEASRRQGRTVVALDARDSLDLAVAMARGATHASLAD